MVVFIYLLKNSINSRFNLVLCVKRSPMVFSVKQFIIIKLDLKSGKKTR